MQMFSQDKLRKKGYSNLKIDNRMPTHRMNIRISNNNRIFWFSPRFQIMLLFMSFSLCAVCKMSVTLALLQKKYDSQSTQTSQNTECPVGYSVYFLFNYIFIKYLFVCENTLSSVV